MGTSQNDVVIMEGWLYLIRCNRFGLHHFRKRYFVLQHNHLLHTFKSKPHFSMNKDPTKTLAISSSTRVSDNGSESIQRKVLFIFTLLDASNPHERVKLGATCPEEASRWIQILREATLKADLNPRELVDFPKRDWEYVRLNSSSRVHGTGSLDWACCSASPTDHITADVLAPSTWTIFGCHNGLRLFKETKDRECPGKSWDNCPGIMAMGVVNGTSEAIFQTFMSLGSSRSEWDFCFYRGNVIERLDGQTDIIHKLLYGDWQPWGMKRRDLLLRRYWRREEDGTYVILYHSVLHKKCPRQKDYVRASLKSGGYVITPVNQGEQSVVSHMLAIDWKYWKPYRQASSAQSITIRMLGRLAALREMFNTKPGGYSSSELTLRELMSDSRLRRNEKTMIAEAQMVEDEDNGDTDQDDVVESPVYHSCRVELDNGADEFLPSDPLDYDKCTVQKRGCTDLQDMVREDSVSCNYGTTLPHDPTRSVPSSWSAADTSIFEIRGKTYLRDHKKIMAKGTLMQMVGVDFVRSDKREDDLAGRPGSIVQKYAANGGPEFFFIVNMQVPGSPTYSLAFYHMMSAPVEDSPLLASFIKGDDAYRNSRFKLIASFSQGPWIVKQSIRKKACRLAQRLPITYVHGHNYLELDVDVGGTALSRGLTTMVFGYFNHVVVEIAFLIEANTEEELPEDLLGAFQLKHLDISKAVWVKQP